MTFTYSKKEFMADLDEVDKFLKNVKVIGDELKRRIDFLIIIL